MCLESPLLPFERPAEPLVVALGVGTNSVALLVGLAKLGIRPDAILFADTGTERVHTYQYLYAVLPAWLEKVGFPQVQVVRYRPAKFKNWPIYSSLLENCLTNRTLPSISYGRSACSAKWKISCQNKALAEWAPARECWSHGGKVRKAIGFDASARDRQRACGSLTYAIQDDESDRFTFWFALQEWGWDRERCAAEIAAAGLPSPEKSACFVCAGMKPREVSELSRRELQIIVIVEARARLRHLDYAAAKGWPNGVGKPMTEGIWRRATKGLRKGSVARPGSMTEYIAAEGLLPAGEVERLIALTPTRDLFRGEIVSWETWLAEICARAEAGAGGLAGPIEPAPLAPMLAAA